MTRRPVLSVRVPAPPSGRGGPWLTVNNTRGRNHHALRARIHAWVSAARGPVARAAQRARAAGALPGDGSPADPPVAARAVLVFSTLAVRDLDGHTPTVKAVIDAVRAAGVLEDDRWTMLRPLILDARKATPGEGESVELTLVAHGGQCPACGGTGTVGEGAES